MEISTLFLARIQFALSLNAHVLFAALAMALGWILCVFRYQAWQAPESGWTAAYRFWVRTFALSFFLALATALPVLIEFGTLWPALIERTGNVAGPLLAFGLATFFITKALFMGIVLFGQRRVSAKVHFFAVLMVALGLTLTLFWVVVLHTWAQAPVGAAPIDGRYQVYEWSEVILTPFVLWRSLGFVAGAFLFAGFLLLSVTAWQALRRPLDAGEHLSFRAGVLVALCALLLYWAALDGNARMVARYQPAVAAAQVGYWYSSASPEWVWLGSPNVKTRSTAVFLASDLSAQRWLGRQANESLLGLDLTGEVLPPVVLLFWLLRAALLAGALSSALMLFTLIVVLRKGLEPARYPKWLLRTLVWSGGLGALTWLLNWNLSDLGRAPYLVWGSLLQQDAVVQAPPATLAWVLAAALACYALMVTGFIQLLWHAARFGVVPVRKPWDATMIDALAASLGLSASAPSFWMPLLMMALLFVLILGGALFDGFDIGVGVLVLLAPRHARSQLMVALSPWRDANGFWWLLAVGLFLAAFPLAWGAVLGALYVPMSLTVLGVMLRSVAFEFRIRAATEKRDRWIALFWLGSLLTALGHGGVLAQLVLGLKQDTPEGWFTVFIALCTVAAYALLGACWLVMRLQGELQLFAARWARHAIRWAAAGMVALSIALGLANPAIFYKWSSATNLVLAAPVWLLMLGCFVGIDMSLTRVTQSRYRSLVWLPFTLCWFLFVALLGGLTYSMFPFVVLDTLTLWDAASAQGSLQLVLAATIVVLPIMVIFNLMTYRGLFGRAP